MKYLQKPFPVPLDKGNEGSGKEVEQGSNRLMRDHRSLYVRNLPKNRLGKKYFVKRIQSRTSAIPLQCCW